jgi:hypothetical protein
MMMFLAKPMTSRDWIQDDVFGKIHDDDSVLLVRLEQGTGFMMMFWAKSMTTTGTGLMMMFSAKSTTTTASCGCDWSRDWMHDYVFGKVHDKDSNF